MGAVSLEDHAGGFEYRQKRRQIQNPRRPRTGLEDDDTRVAHPDASGDDGARPAEELARRSQLLRRQSCGGMPAQIGYKLEARSGIRYCPPIIQADWASFHSDRE